MKMVNLINFKSISTKIILFFIMAILFSQIFMLQVVADETKDGSLEINSGDWRNIQCDTSTTIL